MTDLCRCGSDLPHNTDLQGDTMTDLETLTLTVVVEGVTRDQAKAVMTDLHGQKIKLVTDAGLASAVWYGKVTAGAITNSGWTP